LSGQRPRLLCCPLIPHPDDACLFTLDLLYLSCPCPRRRPSFHPPTHSHTHTHAHTQSLLSNDCCPFLLLLFFFVFFFFFPRFSSSRLAHRPTDRPINRPASTALERERRKSTKTVTRPCGCELVLHQKSKAPLTPTTTPPPPHHVRKSGEPLAVETRPGKPTLSQKTDQRPLSGLPTASAQLPPRSLLDFSPSTPNSVSIEPIAGPSALSIRTVPWPIFL
jgi:hypothetical protein